MNNAPIFSGKRKNASLRKRRTGSEIRMHIRSIVIIFKRLKKSEFAEENHLKCCEEKIISTTIAPLKKLQREHEDRGLSLRIVEEMEKEFRSTAREEKPREICADVIERSDALRRLEVKTGGMFRKIYAQVPERLQRSPQPAPRLPRTLRNCRHPAIAFREENAEPVGVARVVRLKDKRFGGANT